MKNIKPEEKLLYAGAASRLADSFAEEGFEVVNNAEWIQRGADLVCSNCKAKAHIHHETKLAIATPRCHSCGSRMSNPQE